MTGTDGSTYYANASGASGGSFTLVVPPHAVAQAGLLTLASGSRIFPVVVYAAPIFVSIQPTQFTTAGQISATLTLAGGSQPVLSSSGLKVRIICAAAAGRPVAETIAETSNSTVFWYTASDATPAADFMSLSFTQEVRSQLACSLRPDLHVPLFAVSSKLVVVVWFR